MSDHRRQDQYWALLAGVNFYVDPHIADLQFAVADARELREVLIAPPYNLNPAQIILLESTDPQNNQAMRRNILRELRRIARSAREGDWLLFYYSGHGTVVREKPYLCPSDTEAEELLEETAIPLAKVREIVETSAASVKVMIFDACHLGARLGAKTLAESAKAFAEEAKQVFRDMRGIAMLASSALEEISIEVEQKRHGIFTYFLLEALKNPRSTDRNGDARISVTELLNYVASRLQDYGQQPTILLEGRGDLPVFPLPPQTPIPNLVRRVFPSPVRDPADFFGRAEELRCVKETLLYTSDTLILIHGERCIGKTSFLNRIKALLDTDSGPEARFLHFAIEPSGIRTVEDFARELWNGLQQVSQTIIPADYTQERQFSFVGYTRFGFELEEMLCFANNYRFVVFVDEFEKLKQATDAVTINQIMGLLRFVIEQTNLPIAFVLSSLEEPGYLWSSFGSPPPNLQIVLKPLDRGDCDAMLSSFLPRELAGREQILDQIYLASGGHPYFAKLLASEICDEINQNPLRKADLASLGWEDVLTRAVEKPEADHVFTFLYEHFSDEERYVLLSLAMEANYSISGQEVARWRVSYRVAARRLEERHYLIPLADGGYCFRLPLLGRWLRNWHRLPLELERLGLMQVGIPAISEGICIDETSGKIYLDGKLINTNLPNLQYKALLYLARNAGRVVSRQELYEVLHGEDETYLPTDQSLDALIYRLRLALGDKGQRYLKTLRKRGYLLVQATIISRNLS